MSGGEVVLRLTTEQARALADIIAESPDEHPNAAFVDWVIGQLHQAPHRLAQPAPELVA